MDAKAGDQMMSEMNTRTRKKKGKKLMESSKIEGLFVTRNSLKT